MIIKTVLTALLGLSITGCTVITSEHIHSGEAWQKVGIPYYLPKTVFLAEIETKRAGSAGAATPSTPAAPANPYGPPAQSNPYGPPAAAPGAGAPGAQASAEPPEAAPGEMLLHLTIKQQAVPDPEHLYVLQFHPQAFYADRVRVQVSPNGLLRGIFTGGVKDSALGAVEVTSASGTTASSAYGGGYSGYGASGASPYGSSSPYGGGYGGGGYGGGAYGGTGYGSSYGGGAPGMPVGMEPPAGVPDIIGPPIHLYVRMVAPNPAPPWWNQFVIAVASLAGKHSHQFSAEAPAQEWTVGGARGQALLGVEFSVERILAAGAKPGGTAKTRRPPAKDNGGVKMKIAKPYYVNFAIHYRGGSGDDEVAKLRTVALMPDESEVFTLPLDRYFMVESTVAAAFQNGQLVQHEIGKPSFPKNVASIPLDILGAVLDTFRSIGSAAFRTVTGPAMTAVGAGAGGFAR